MMSDQDYEFLDGMCIWNEIVFVVLWSFCVSLFEFLMEHAYFETVRKNAAVWRSFCILLFSKPS